MWTIFAVCIEFVTVLLSVFMVFWFCLRHMRSWLPQAGTEPAHWEILDYRIPFSNLKVFFFFFFRLPSTSEGDSASYLEMKILL